VRCTFVNNAAIAATNVIAALLLYLEYNGRAAKYLEKIKDIEKPRCRTP